MTDQACQRYLEDPEENAGHLETCAECRAMNAALSANADVDAAPISLDSLPLAPWEGSSHRAWPLVLGAAAAVILIAFVLCDLAGISPMHVAESSLTSMEARRDILRNATEWLRAAPAAWQLAFGVAFIVVNALLVVLLRRAPRGIDA
jgi:hypothetical protein